VIAGFLFLMPFIAVSCDAPGGFGQAAPGGTTTYIGLDLVVGGTPDVTPADKVREGASEKLDPQPLAVVALLLVLAGIAVTAAVQSLLVRRAVATLLAGGAAIALAANQLTVQSHLAAQLTAQLTVAMPEGKQAADYVKTQPGFWFCVVTLVVLVMVYGTGWIRSATRIGSEPATLRIASNDE
jgi:hypothetical protein